MRHRYVLKPVFWNTRGYVGPSGVKAAKDSFPSYHGLGLEEWNNSPRMAFGEDGVPLRAFHTEGLGNFPVEEYDGSIMVLMYASHDGVQELVGVAGGATCLMPDDRRGRRLELVERLGIDAFWRDGWETATVQRAYGGDQARFLENWRRDLHWIPNWTCPAELYLWLRTPVRLDAPTLTGKGRLNTRFTSFTEVPAQTARFALAAVPPEERGPVWERLVGLTGATDLPAASAPAPDGGGVDAATTRQALAAARMGQGRFRAQLESRWKGACAVLGIVVREVLRASHMKPWQDSTDAERLNPANGLLLAAHLDALFDRGLISFADDGRMLISRSVKQADRELLAIPSGLRLKLRPAELRFLAYHRDNVFRR
jgi:hypothetical protein